MKPITRETYASDSADVVSYCRFVSLPSTRFLSPFHNFITVVPFSSTEHLSQLIVSAKEVMNALRFSACLSVCLLATLRKNY